MEDACPPYSFMHVLLSPPSLTVVEQREEKNSVNSTHNATMVQLCAIGNPGSPIALTASSIACTQAEEKSIWWFLWLNIPAALWTWGSPGILLASAVSEKNQYWSFKDSTKTLVYACVCELERVDPWRKHNNEPLTNRRWETKGNTKKGKRHHRGLDGERNIDGWESLSCGRDAGCSTGREEEAGESRDGVQLRLSRRSWRHWEKDSVK